MAMLVLLIVDPLDARLHAVHSLTRDSCIFSILMSSILAFGQLEVLLLRL
jgi:hypothetical protein